MTVDKELRDHFNEDDLVRVMPDGAKIYEFNGMSICHSQYCIQEKSKGYDTRSLIYQADGHLYTSWNSKATILF